MKGSYLVGFSIDTEYFWASRYSLNPIGAYGCSFKKRALFAYKTETNMDALFIRTKKWRQIITNDDFSDIMDNFLKKVKENYEQKIKIKLKKAKDLKFRARGGDHWKTNTISLQFLKNERIRIREEQGVFFNEKVCA